MQPSNSKPRWDDQILRIRSLFAPPVFQGDDVKTRRARMLNIALINVFVLIPVLVIGNLLGGKTPRLVIGVNFVAFALCSVLYFWMRQGRIRLASIGLMALGLVGITAAIASLGTVRAPSVAMYLLMIITAGLLFDLAGIVVTTVLCSFLVAGLIVAGNMGLLPPPNYSVTITQWFAYTAIFGWTASLTFSSLRSMYIALAQADNELTMRKLAEAELTKHSEHLEESVKVRTSELQEKNVMLTEEITDRKLVERALQESEEKYRLLIDTANESVVVAQDGLLKFVNPITLGLLGAHSEQELIDRPFPQFIHPDDRSMVVENYRRRIANEASTPRYAFRIVTRDGTVKWVEINATLIEWQGKPATLNFLTDITEHKQAEKALLESEARYRRIVETANEGIMMMDDQFRYTFVNQKLADMLGYTPQEMIGQPVTAFIFEEDLPDHLAKMEKRVSGLGSQYERRHRRKDGSTCWTMVSATALKDETGRFAGSFAMLTDITERRLIEDELKKTHDELELRVKDRTAELEARNAEMERFIYTVSHELRSPLISTGGLVGFLKKDLEMGDANGTETDLKLIEGAVAKMDQLLTEILELSRIGRVANPL